MGPGWQKYITRSRPLKVTTQALLSASWATTLWGTSESGEGANQGLQGSRDNDNVSAGTAAAELAMEQGTVRKGRV